MADDGYQMRQEVGLRVPMRDGVELSLRVYRPDAPGAFPALLAVSPYQHATDDLPHSALFLWHEVGPVAWYVAQGYVYVHADVRGTGQSGGTYGFLDMAEQTDLYDLIQWVAGQAWCDGNVGGIGQSYYAWSQWFMGVMNPPALRCIAPYDGSIDLYRDAAYHGGIYCDFLNWWYNLVRNNNLQRMPGGPQGRLMEADIGAEFTSRQTYDDWWRERSALERIDRIEVPVLSIGHWGKMGLHLRGNIVGYEDVTAPKRLIVTGAKDVFEAHELFDRIDFHRDVLLPFYDHWLKGKESHAERSAPPVRLYVNGREEWRDAAAWPLPEAREVPFFLSARPAGAVASLNDGSLDTDPPEDSDATTSYDYPDPGWTLGVARMTPQGPDPLGRVLTFTTPPLEADIEVTGPIRMELFLESTAEDTDVFVKLSDQGPGEGRPTSCIVSRGWLRASHHSRRDEDRSRPWRPVYSHDAPQPITPGEVVRLEIELMPCAHLFRAGHRLRLEIANGDSPVTDGLFTHLYGWWKVGRDTIHHCDARPSKLILPVVGGPD